MPHFVNLFYNKCNFSKVSEQTFQWSHWGYHCHMTIPKPIPGKWNGVIIISLDQLSFPLALEKGPVSPGKHLAAWQVNKIWSLSAKEMWLLCIQSQCLPQQGPPNGSPVLPVVILQVDQDWEEHPDFLLAFPNIPCSLSTSCPDGHRGENIFLPLSTPNFSGWDLINQTDRRQINKRKQTEV